MIKHNKIKKSLIIGTAIIATFSAYFINPKPVFAQQEQEKTVVIGSEKYYNYGTVDIISNKHNDLTKEEKQMILEEREKIAFEEAEKYYNEREWRKAMSRYSFLAYFPKYKEYAIERAYECMDNACYYSLGVLKEILVIVNKYTPAEQKQKIKSSELYEEIADTYMLVRAKLLTGNYYASRLEEEYPHIREIDPEYKGFWADIN